MSREVEIEAKVLLNYKAYRKLLRYFNVDQIAPKVQTNYYFDTTDDNLRAAHLALRVRALNETFTLTLKIDLDEGRLEVNDPLTPEQFKALMNGTLPADSDVAKALVEAGIAPSATFTCFGQLTTKRHTIETPNGIACLDFNMYEDYVDYEFEFEADSMDNSKAAITAIMETLGLPFAFTNTTKIGRVLSALED